MRWFWLVLIILAGTLSGALITRFERTAPVIHAKRTQTWVGRSYAHEVTVYDEGMGLEKVRIWLERGSEVHELVAQSYPGSLLFGADVQAPRHLSAQIEPKQLGLADGQILLRIEARDYSWAGNRSQLQVPLTIDTHGPRISVETGLTYVRRGGTELAVYRLDEDVAEHGVRLDGQLFRGFRHPRDPSRRIAFYAFPPETRPEQVLSVYASDRAGNETTTPLATSIIERSFPRDRISLSESFMRRKVGELLGGEPDDLLAAFLQINGDMRVKDAERILEISEHTSAEQLWRGPFLQLPGSNVGARFAEFRDYEYQGQVVDHQIHMGYDLASTARASVPAANDGVVTFAGDLGIYGNTVILDHGLSLLSLYGHLSEIAVEQGQAVARGERIGATGQTGLAGGDHLHYAMMVGGIFVDPLEWFDGRWIREHVEAKLTVTQAAVP